MIQVSLSVLILIFLGLMLGPIFALWLLNEYRHQRRERAAFQHVLRCRMCSFEFADGTDALLPRCPRCGSLNERLQVSRL